MLYWGSVYVAEQYPGAVSTPTNNGAIYMVFELLPLLGKKSLILATHIIFSMFHSTVHLWWQQTITSQFLRHSDVNPKQHAISQSLLQLKFSLVFPHLYSLLDFCIHSNNRVRDTRHCSSLESYSYTRGLRILLPYSCFSDLESNRFAAMFIIPGLYRASGGFSQVCVEWKHTLFTSDIFGCCTTLLDFPLGTE